MGTERDQDQILTTEQAGRLLKASKQTISRMAKAGILPHFRVGNRYRFSRRVIMEIVRTAGQPQAAPQGQTDKELPGQ